MNDYERFIAQPTDDGSLTFFSAEFDEAFHSYRGAKQEAEIKYVQPTMIREKARRYSKIYLLDICYGLGYDSAAAIEAIWSINPQCQIEAIALELNAAVPRQASAEGLLCQWRQPIPQLLDELASNSQVRNKYLSAKLCFGDARQTLQQIYCQGWQADAIFLDPFSPPKCPQLWTVEFIAMVAKCLKPTGRLATYSCAAAVRRALSLAGLKFGSIYVANSSPGTVASFVGDNLPLLSLQEREHLHTRAAIPYRDPSLNNSAARIKEHRLQEQKQSQLEPTSQWKKRWLSLRHQ
ncbi:tRNA (5-methylaminomethyl-2-thiouridine)(34)-methyltransferase MnmD [Myxosarcina sp. GI1(2024)]